MKTKRATKLRLKYAKWKQNRDPKLHKMETKLIPQWAPENETRTWTGMDTTIERKSPLYFVKCRKKEATATEHRAKMET